MRWIPIMMSAALAAGCSPSLTTMAPARTAEAGQVRAAVSADFATSPADVRAIAGEMEALSEQRPSEIDQRDRAEAEELIEEAAMVLVSPPSLGLRAQAAIGITDWLEVGASTSVNTARGNLRMRLFALEEPGIYGVASIGAGMWLSSYPIGLVTDDVKLEEHSRWDLEAALHLGASGRVGDVWLGPKIVRSRYSIGYSGCVRRSQGECSEEANVGIDGTALYYGGQVGLALGGEHVRFGLELSVMRLAVDADLTADAMGYSATRGISREGWVISPSVGVMIGF